MNDIGYGFGPIVAVFADTETGLAEASGYVEAAGARIGARGDIAGALDALDARSCDAVLVDAMHDGGAVLDRLLARLNGDAAAGRLRSVVMVDPALIDIAAAATPHRDVALVCRGAGLECVASLGLALMPVSETLLFEERGDDASLQLRRVREEVSRLARALATVAGNGETRFPTVTPTVAEPTDAAMADVPVGQILRALIRARRLRDQFFDAELFADPAWDMLLDLMLAQSEGRSVAVSSLCIAAAVPPTTALRWIKRMTDEGLFLRTADPLDGRRVFIDLSDDGVRAMAHYLRANHQAGQQAV